MTLILESAPIDAPQQIDAASRETLFTQAATANSFAAAPVGDDELRSIWELAKWPPTSANFQPMRVLFVQSSEGRSRLGTFMNDKNRQKTVAAPAVAVLHSTAPGTRTSPPPRRTSRT